MLGLQIIFLVTYIESSSLPLIRVLLLVFLYRVHKRLHALRVARLVLLEVHEVKSVRVACT